MNTTYALKTSGGPASLSEPAVLAARNHIGAQEFLGIDLGTTNSTAVVADGECLLKGEFKTALRLVPVRQESEFGAVESPLLPSVVGQIRPGSWVTGAGAKELRRHGLRKNRQIFYSTKSDMGVGKDPTYPFAASAEVNSSYKVAARILSSLRDAVAARSGEDVLQRVVITVPASFQVAARKDTLRAAQLAGLAVSERALLDEPNAAFLDYLLTETPQSGAGITLDFSGPRVVLVVDFGGGTCDVSILRVQAGHGGTLGIANLSISRYERLGGDNIDAAIAEEVLLREVLCQNRLGFLDLSWTEKKNFVLPQLTAIAEVLKIGVCTEYARQLSLRSPERIDPKKISATQPSETIYVPSRTCIRRLQLEQPTLTLQQFEQVLAPFLDEDLLYARGTEFNPIISLFAPLKDALDRATLERDQVDAVLLVGGSSLIPQVEHAIGRFFANAEVLKYADPGQSLFAVARGAALHSFFLHGLGSPLLKPIAQETIGILVLGGGFMPLVPAGTELPWPQDGNFGIYSGLRAPRTLARELEVVIAADNDKKVLAVGRLPLQELAKPDEPVELKWKLDANKVLTVEASFQDAHCEIVLENPLCATGYESDRQRRIVELEQQVAQSLSTGKPISDLATDFEALAELYYEDKRYERCMDWARKALQARNHPEVWMLTLVGNAYLNLGEPRRAASIYREAITAEFGCGSAHFNLSLALERITDITEALAAVERAIQLEPSEGAFLAQKARLLMQLGREADARRAYIEARDLLEKARPLSQFQMSWRLLVAEKLGEQEKLRELRDQARKANQLALPYDPKNLPQAEGGLALKRT